MYQTVFLWIAFIIIKVSNVTKIHQILQHRNPDQINRGLNQRRSIQSIIQQAMHILLSVFKKSLSWV